jgi:mono/diheme cytochrome c family protein
MFTKMAPRLGAAGTLVTGALLFLFVAAGSRANADTAPAPLLPVQADGQQVYNAYCMSCHMPEGQGLEESIPPLAGSEWVTGDVGRLVLIILHGVTGPIMVAGTEYNGMMAPLGGVLDDAQIAAVSTYIRTAWGNDASEVSAAEVESIRKQSADRTTPWTARELTALPAARAN